MDDTTRSEIAGYLDDLANERAWNPELWQKCHDSVPANWDDEMLAYIYDDIVHYSGEFHSRSILGFRTKPNQLQLENYRYEFRSVAASLREGLSLNETKRKYGL